VRIFCQIRTHQTQKFGGDPHRQGARDSSPTANRTSSSKSRMALEFQRAQSWMRQGLSIEGRHWKTWGALKVRESIIVRPLWNPIYRCTDHIVYYHPASMLCVGVSRTL